MQKGINPWTGKTKISKNTGLFNQILFKHYPSLQKPLPQNEYLEMIELIETQRNHQNIEQYRDLFDLKSKIAKMNEIIQWMDKVVNNKVDKIQNEQVPINSSFVYIPIHAYNTFHQILKDSINPTKQPLIREQSLHNLKSQVISLQQILQFNDLMMKNIL